jgi:hypothetical protein
MRRCAGETDEEEVTESDVIAGAFAKLKGFAPRHSEQYGTGWIDLLDGMV